MMSVLALDSSLLSLFQMVRPGYQCLWSGPLLSYLWFSCILAQIKIKPVALFLASILYESIASYADGPITARYRFSALNPPLVYSSDRSKAVVPVLVLLFVALWFILRGNLFYVLPCVILFLCFSVILALRIPRLGKRELILVLFVRLFDLCLFGFVGFLFLLVSGKGCG